MQPAGHPVAERAQAAILPAQLGAAVGEGGGDEVAPPPAVVRDGDAHPARAGGELDGGALPSRGALAVRLEHPRPRVEAVAEREGGHSAGPEDAALTVAVGPPAPGAEPGGARA